MEVLEEWKTREEESWLILLLELICKGKAYLVNWVLMID